MTLRVSTIIGIVTIIMGVGGSIAIAKANAETLMDRMDDHEERLRAMETCVSDIGNIRDTVRDVPAMRTDIRWIVYNQEQMMRTMERIEGRQ